MRPRVRQVIRPGWAVLSLLAFLTSCGGSSAPSATDRATGSTGSSSPQGPQEAALIEQVKKIQSDMLVVQKDLQLCPNAVLYAKPCLANLEATVRIAGTDVEVLRGIPDPPSALTSLLAGTEAALAKIADKPVEACLTDSTAACDLETLRIKLEVDEVLAQMDDWKTYL